MDKEKIEQITKKYFTPSRVIAVLALLLLVAGGSSIYFYRKATADPQAEAQKELQDVIAKVERHMILPQNETPTMATVSDPEKLKGQRFFDNAKTGDKVLIYSVAKKAILYDPSSDRIIEVAPVNTEPK